jgi:hypothetical protein
MVSDALNNSRQLYVPPDPTAAVGPDHVVTAVNDSILWYTKDGHRLSSRSLRLFFRLNHPGPNSKLFDPKVVYDADIGRFIVACLETTDTGDGASDASTSHLYLAVSRDSDPTHDWYVQAIDTKTMIDGQMRWADFPGLATDLDHIYLTCNMFSFGSESDFAGSRLWVVPKFPLYDGGDLMDRVYDPSDGAGLADERFTLQPAQVFQPGRLGESTDLAGDGTFLVSTGFIDGGDLRPWTGPGVDGSDLLSVIRVDIDPGTDDATFTHQFVDVGRVHFPEVGVLPDAPQPGERYRIDPGDIRALSAVYRNYTLWVTNTVNPRALTPTSVERRPTGSRSVPGTRAI